MMKRLFGCIYDLLNGAIDQVEVAATLEALGSNFGLDTCCVD
jgi:hypothetical protein